MSSSIPSYPDALRGHVSANPQVLAALRRDPVLGQLCDLFGAYAWDVHAPLFSLCRAVVGQRISSRAASSIFQRLYQATRIDPVQLLAHDEAHLRSLGLPKSKAKSLHALAHYALEGSLEKLEQQDNAQIILELSRLPGVGLWTVQMLLIFSLARLDVLPMRDLGVIRAAERLYGVPNDDKNALQALERRLQPYGSVAAWYFWRWSEAGSPDLQP